MILIRSKMYQVLPQLVRHPTTKFHDNQAGTFSAILLTDGQINQPTNRTENITSLVDVTKEMYSILTKKQSGQYFFCKTSSAKLLSSNKQTSLADVTKMYINKET